MATGYPDRRWKQLGDALRRRRIDLGYRNLTAFARAGGRGGLAYSLLNAVERGVKTNLAPLTMMRIEQQYQLADGAVDAYLSGRDSALHRASGSDRAAKAAAALVGYGLDRDQLAPTIEALQRIQADLGGQAEAS